MHRITPRILLLCLGLLLGRDALAETLPDSTEVRSPGKALTLSLVPGGGQLYNQRPVKALLFGGTFIYFAVQYAGAQSNYLDNPDDQTLHRTRNDQVWLMTLTWALNLIDAYVDAQLWDFNNYSLEDLPTAADPTEQEEMERDNEHQ